MDYFLSNYKHGLDLVHSLEEFKEKDFNTEIPVPTLPREDMNEQQKLALKEVYSYEMKHFMNRKELLKTNLVQAYGIIWGQCTKGMKSKLESRKEWNNGSPTMIKYNAINLLKAIKQITHNYQDNKHPIESVFFALKNVFYCKQEENENLNDFTKRFTNAIDILESLHGPVVVANL